MSSIIALLHPITIQHEQGGWWDVVLHVTTVALVIDVLANYTELALLTWDFPKKGEFTFSQRLVRLKRRTDWRGTYCTYIAIILDKIAPSGKHIP